MLGNPLAFSFSTIVVSYCLKRSRVESCFVIDVAGSTFFWIVAAPVKVFAISKVSPKEAFTVF